MELPSTNEDYREKTYWDERYTSEESYDWFSEYSSFSHILQEHISKENNILALGCGNSLLSEEMYRDGMKHITNIDFSPVVIERMEDKYRYMPEMTWRVMDILDMKFPGESFDIILEKGTLDALLVHEKDPWNISEESCLKIDKILEQISSILKPDGKFISITFAQPHFRKPMYVQQKYNWSLKTRTFGDMFHFFCYIMQKGQKLSDKDVQIETERQKMKEKQKHELVVYLEENDTNDFLLACPDKGTEELLP